MCVMSEDVARPGDSHQRRFSTEFLVVFATQLPLSQRSLLPNRVASP